MTPGSSEFPAAVGAVLAAAQHLPEVVPGIVAVGLAGSWACSAGRADSDVDLVVLSNDRELLLDSTSWFAVFDGRAELIRCADFGAVAERRLRLPDGLVVEVGVAAPSWAATDPVDTGTRQVVGDGFAAVYDPTGLLAALVAAVAGR